MMKKLILIFLMLAKIINAGPITMTACIGACNAGVVACYAALGYTFGTVTAGAGVPSSIIACNTAQGVCMTGCHALLFAPTP